MHPCAPQHPSLTLHDKGHCVAFIWQTCSTSNCCCNSNVHLWTFHHVKALAPADCLEPKCTSLPDGAAASCVSCGCCVPLPCPVAAGSCWVMLKVTMGLWARVLLARGSVSTSCSAGKYHMTPATVPLSGTCSSRAGRLHQRPGVQSQNYERLHNGIQIAHPKQQQPQ